MSTLQLDGIIRCPNTCCQHPSNRVGVSLQWSPFCTRLRLRCEVCGTWLWRGVDTDVERGLREVLADYGESPNRFKQGVIAVED